MAYQSIVTIEHDCDLIKLSKDLDTPFWVYCTKFYDYFIFKDGITEGIAHSVIETLNYDVEKENNLSNLIHPPSNLILPCPTGNPQHLMHFYPYIFQSLGIVFELPYFSSFGETYLYHCLDSKSQSQTLERLNKIPGIKLQSNREYDADEYYGAYMFSISDVISDLTNNQTNLLIKAYREGYYDIPRQIRTQDIAKSIGKSRYTIDKTIRAAEEKIMKYVYRFLR